MTAELLQGKSICFIGTLQNYTRVAASKLAEAVGARVMKSITKNTNIVVCATGATVAKKAEAKKKGCELWTEEQFMEALGEEWTEDQFMETVGEEPPAVDDEENKSEEEEAEEEEEEDDESAKKPAAKKKPTAKKTTAAKKKTAAKKPAAKKAAVTEPPGTPPPKKKAKSDPSTTPMDPPVTPKSKPATPAAATPANPGSRERKVMSCIPDGSSYRVYADYDCKLMLSDQVTMNSNKFYKLQLLEKNGRYHVATNWGRLGEAGKHQVKGPFDEQKGIAEFSKVFRSKTKNAWGAHPFVRYGDKYQLIETTIDDAEGDTAAGDQALGRLTEAQIQKGQAVLQNIRSVLEQREQNKRARVDRDELGNLSNDFYSLIPTQSGRQKPPLLDNIDIITEKEGLLEFWLRMGFEELSPQDVDGSPIQGVFDLPVPKTLIVAASSIADRHSITSSQSRGRELSQNAVGSPMKEMGPELYAAILLYTGNSIYRELNRCLRVEWKSAKRYWNYLRLYFEATDCLPKKNVTLWRGIAADLYDEYEPGKIITWWTVSSCTASQSVAQNFMNQLGGSAATLLTLHTKRACDISALSFYPHEQESLLNPGTKLKVLNRTRNGRVAEIEVEEVLEELDNAKKETNSVGGDDDDVDVDDDDKKEAAVATDLDEKKPAARE